MRRKAIIGALAAIVWVSPQIGPSVGAALAAPTASSGPVVKARASEPVVITGANIPTWSHAAPTGAPAAYPSGSPTADGGDGARSAHNGYLVFPPDARTGVNPEQIAAYRWNGSAWTEIPVQVDQMFPNFLANGHSTFAVYSGTDMEMTYAWNPTAHSIGEESWKKVFGGTVGVTAPGYTDPTPCSARYQQPGPAGLAELAAAKVKQPGQSYPVVSEPTDPMVAADDYTQAMADPVNALTGTPQLDDDDQISMMAGDAGFQAPSGTPQPSGTFPNKGQQITVVDPTSSTDGSAQNSYIYLFLQPGGSHFTWQNGYVQMTRSAIADQWIDRYSFSPSDTEQIGTSNTGYGPNLGGNVCVTAADNNANPPITTPNGQPRPSSDRNPPDTMTVTTPTYRVYASGRWMVRQLNVTAPGTKFQYGPNLISRWKGRAFQSSPDSSVSVVGFEDEQVNWEMNSALLGWKVGPVRAIREIWGADSGTNVTKTEIYYRDAFTYQYHVRVHPIPPDGLYTSWDMRYGQDTMYYNQLNPQGIPIDGTNSHSTGEVDQVPVSGQPAFFNACDPTHDICTVINNPEEVAGPHGAMVFTSDILPSHLVSNVPSAVPDPSTVLNPAAVPFYRDDACFDDGTGDAPVPRPHPGGASTDANVQQGYVDYWITHGAPANLQYSDLKCAPPQPGQTGYQQPGFDTYQTMPFQGAIGELGVHYFFTADTDNAFTGIPLDELDAEVWAYPVPLSQPANLISTTASATGQDYGLNVDAPLQTVVAPFNAPATSSVSTTVTDDATGQAWTNAEQTGATAHDTAAVAGQQTGVPATGTVTYSLFGNGSCTAPATSTQTVALDATGGVPDSSSTGALAPGSYAYRAAYSGDANYTASTSPCEPFTVHGWRLQPITNPSGAKAGSLSSVACPSTTLCIAVGTYTNSSGLTVTLAERWNGSTWAVQSTPNPTGATTSLLRGVACPSTTSCTAVGYYTNSSGLGLTLAERWNGSAWAIQSTPNPSGAKASLLSGIACASTTVCTAVGYASAISYSSGVGFPLAERWNGSGWAIQPTAYPAGTNSSVLRGVACPSTTVCIAAGSYRNGAGVNLTLAEGWNGSSWAIQSTPNPTGATTSVFRGVSCPSSTLCTAVGTYSNSSGVALTFAESWSGSAWAIQSTANPAGAKAGALNGVACPSSTPCTAVGNYTNSSGVSLTLAEGWDGSSWAIQSTPNPTGAKASVLSGAACPSTALCTAVGNYVNSSGVSITLAERYS